MGSLEYNIAGPADDEDYAQAEYLAEMLMVSLPTITCNLVPVMPDDWGAFAKQKCAFLGCRERAPLIWLNSGAVVGGLKEFSKECAEKYGVEIKGVDVRSHRDRTQHQHTPFLSPALIIILLTALGEEYLAALLLLTPVRFPLSCGAVLDVAQGGQGEFCRREEGRCRDGRAARGRHRQR